MNHYSVVVAINNTNKQSYTAIYRLVAKCIKQIKKQTDIAIVTQYIA